MCREASFVASTLFGDRIPKCRNVLWLRRSRAANSFAAGRSPQAMAQVAKDHSSKQRRDHQEQNADGQASPVPSATAGYRAHTERGFTIAARVAKNQGALPVNGSSSFRVTPSPAGRQLHASSGKKNVG
jgi:hypothetical protein